MPRHTKEEVLSTPDLTAKEVREADKRVAVTAQVVHEAIRIQGDEELARPASALAWSGFAAGLSMSFSLIAEGLLRSLLPNAPWTWLLVSLGYPFGYLIVIIARQQLFTENTLTAVIPVLARRDLQTFRRMLRLWGVVLFANLVGVHAAAWILGHAHMFPVEVQQAFFEIGQRAAAVTPGVAIIKGVFAGWLIALVVWMLASARGDHLAIILILTYFVGLGGFTHVIAGSIDVLYLVLTGAWAWGDWAILYFLPTLLGNVLGGVSLVSLLNHAQVVSGQSHKADV
ncbi:MAG TPA: formate/nitrite transporter family protein [Bryobacteraceae bacterium]|nr:formate/nitrite transporter family protein [Bryobacteraceae bacterium]